VATDADKHTDEIKNMACPKALNGSGKLHSNSPITKAIADPIVRRRMKILTKTSSSSVTMTKRRLTKR
jgi:hypothetical protein